MRLFRFSENMKDIDADEILRYTKWTRSAMLEYHDEQKKFDKLLMDTDNENELKPGDHEDNTAETDPSDDANVEV